MDEVNVITDIDKANEFFSECFNSTLNNDDWNNIRINQDECPTDILCSEDEVLEMLCSPKLIPENRMDRMEFQLVCFNPVLAVFLYQLR